MIGVTASIGKGKDTINMQDNVQSGLWIHSDSQESDCTSALTYR